MLEKLSLDFQHSIIKLMITNEQFALNCLAHLESSYFENKYLYWIFNKIKIHYEKYKKVPNFEYLEDQLKTLVEDEKPSYSKIIEIIKTKEVTNEDYMKSEITTFIQTSEFKKMHGKEAELFNNGNYEEAFQYVQDQITKIKQIKFVDDTYIKSKDIDDILEQAKDPANERIPFGVPIFEQEMGGGVPKSAVTTILGSWNCGKSIVILNMVYHMAMSKRKVLYLFHEGRKNQIILRLISRFTGIPYNSLLVSDYQESDKRKIEAAKQIVEKYVRVKEMREIGVSVEDVYNYAKQTHISWGGFDALFSDYGQRLSTNSISKKMEMRHLMTHIWQTLDSTAAELKIAVITAAQFNRAGVMLGKSGEIMRSTNISESAGIAHSSEVIITLNRTAEQSDSNKLILYLDKNRDGKNGLLCSCNTDFRRMRTFDKLLGFENLGYSLETKE